MAAGWLTEQINGRVPTAPGPGHLRLETSQPRLLDLGPLSLGHISCPCPMTLNEAPIWVLMGEGRDGPPS